MEAHMSPRRRHVRDPLSIGWNDETIAHALDVSMRSHSERVAVVDGPVRLTYGRLHDHMTQVAGSLPATGVRPGSTMIIQLSNRWEFLVLLLACLRTGVLPALMLPAYRHHELVQVARHIDAAAVAVSADAHDYDLPGLVRGVVSVCPSIRTVLCVGGTPGAGATRLEDLMADRRGEPTASAHQTILASRDALLLMSSGTTGAPKLIARTHRDYLYGIRASSSACGFSADTVYLAALPSVHTFALGCPGILGALLAGGRVVLVPSPRPAMVFDAIAREHVTVTSAVPAVAARWLGAYDRTRHDLSSLEILQIGGARPSSRLTAELGSALGCRLQQVYGMSEGLLNCTRPGDDPEVVLHTQGRPVGRADEIEVVDESGARVPPGARGELITRGPGIFRGYYGARSHDRDAFTQEGWFRTGDLVRLLPSGNLVVEGRIKDTINRGGEKVSAEELEGLLHDVPSVEHVAIVAGPHGELGEQICVCAVPRDGHSPTLTELRASLTSLGVARFKLPEQLFLLDRLPLTSMGKVNKAALRALAAERLRHEGT
ncbi:(2,3-dihydroxybenzoyl)adenylate synthase [Streptomyces lavendulae]|uniref:(2,3-dihydroxybenzoyl)adenylate synthase n=1 Tax=Streptomyces lavendulae TaxID=1914 RepID=UPI0031E970EA